MDRLVSGNQRKDLRIPLNGNVRFSADQFNWNLGKACDISKGGIFIATEKMLKVGSKVYLNFSLKSKYQNIKTIGEVVRLANDEDRSVKQEYSGMGVRFSLLPSEELMMRSVIRGVVNNAVPLRSSSMRQSPKRRLYKPGAKSYLSTSFKWWLKETIKKAFSVNYLIVELVLLVVILMVFVAFL